ncbi:dysferlin-like isoform X3 [Ruditapes philippinarum]|uniref:dysferlin-like isoform X3 n=1 Tax=Ruditapes philippinarum TaxID=129788 RepID=UPI00295BABE8|nr:dysferlin-like isoform X3 [Ruditapes philippinarum]
MSLKVEVISASNVPNLETFGESDPYTTLKYQGISKKTQVIKSDLNPKWNETLEFDLGGVPISGNDQLEVEVKDWERVGRNRLLGTAKVPLADLCRGGTQSKDVDTILMDGNGQPLTQTKLKMKVTYAPPPGQKQAGPAAATTAAGGGGQEVTLDDEGEGEEEEEEEVDPGPPEIDPVTGQPKPRPKKKKKMGKRRFRGKLSNKPQDFQIRIKILEGRQIEGSNIQPVCKVTCFNQVKQTRVQKSTNSPFWNETFFFNFNASPAELFDELLEFTVFNSRKLRSDAMIGSFKMDIGMVWEQGNHAFVNKWLLLGDPEDSMAGAKGYLKFCAIVLGPGDTPPSMSANTTSDESEDIESNLLRPAGVQLRPATFALNVYKCEDIPRMDTAFLQGVKKFFRIGEEIKELVDPYFLMSFAGKEVQTKIMYCNDHPEYNQKLKIGLQFPSMCEKIRLSMKDWDRITEDDCIATAWLRVSLISALGDNGFLPTFGPCFVNFYGSPREFSELPDEYEDLNNGKGEGVAFRGRAMVELKTIGGELPDVPVEDIGSEDVLKVQKFMRKRRFKLHAAFLNATMVSAIDAPVEFEVSIGNYGNKLDDYIAPCASTTQPTNAVFDGSHYYFLPWGGTKPCVVVDAQWEDIAWRLEALNLFEGIIAALESNIEQVKVGVKAKLPTPELAQLLISALDQLVEDCKKPLPTPKKGTHLPTELDTLLTTYRQYEMETLIEMATNLRESATDINEALNEAENFLQILHNLAVEPQNSMPDVIIWMISGEKRIAYYRIPAHTLLYSKNPMYCGRECGKIQAIQMKYPGHKEEKKHDVPALLRIKLWLGLQSEEEAWHQMQKEGEMAVFAETYENQVSILGNWTNRGPMMSRPKFSDSQGKVKLTKEKFVPPPGWQWEGEWYINPELSMLYDKDAGHRTFIDDVYECQMRLPGTNWVESTRPWSNVKGDPSPSKGEMELPAGWVWEDDWQIDLGRAVDEEGFEYCVEATMGGWGSTERRYHLCRRRRWVRSRRLVENMKQKKEKEKHKQAATEGWEYAPLFNMKFHHIERKMDLVRRRRWHRKMVNVDPGAPCFFSMQEADSKSKKKDSDDESEEISQMSAPRMFLQFKNTFKYQLRAYIYQARDILAMDDSGMSDPFARVSFLTQSLRTENIKKSLCPTWDQTLIFEEFEIHGNPRTIEAQPPDIYIELFDHDTFGEPEFLGRAKAHPMVKLDPGDARSPVLQWYEIKRGKDSGGELLAAFELFQMNGKDLPFMPPKRGNLFTVPNGIRPVMQRTGIEVLCWGVRNMKKYQLSSVTSPSIEFEVSGNVVQSNMIKNTKRNPNFGTPHLFFDVMLPKEELYMPPVNIRVRDHRQFGRKPTVGLHVLKSLEKFRIDPVMQGDLDEDDQQAIVGNGPGGEHVVDMPAEGESPKKMFGDVTYSYPQEELSSLKPLNKPSREEEVDYQDIDWWSKYYASIGETEKCQKYLNKDMDKIAVYEFELEKKDGFGEFVDFCETFDLQRGKDDDDEESNIIGQFKGAFKVYPLPSDPNEEIPVKVLGNVPSSEPEDCVIRIYCIRAEGLQPNDPTGLADPYIQIKIGNKSMDSRDNYIPNCLDPVFGTMFEVTTVLPMYKDLTIKVMDYDLVSSDDLIGETVIDLENRLLSKHRATCGLPMSYCIEGPNKWRDAMKPKEVLEEYCKNRNMTLPMFYGNNSAKVGRKVYKLSEFEGAGKVITPDHGPADQRLALHILNTLDLVKEHVEKRPIYNPLQPNIEQGKLVMWVDIFPKSMGEPGPPFDIKARKPKEYMLRAVIYNTVDVILDETSITGEKMSDIYVTGWLQGAEEKQKTDIHYRSLNGEGNFNWRFVFPFEFMPAENCMVVKKKEKFWSLDETEQRLPAIFMIQVWDNDKFSFDDFLGTVELNLNNMPMPSKRAGSCDLKQLPDITMGNTNVKTVSLFEQKRLRGFWPVYDEKNGHRELTGKVEMEIELITKDEADVRPAGKARDEPNMNPVLEPPNRPETSFLWFTSPFKTLRYIIWANYKWYFIIGLLVLLLILLVFLFIYFFPGNFSAWILGNN